MNTNDIDNTVESILRAKNTVSYNLAKNTIEIEIENQNAEIEIKVNTEISKNSIYPAEFMSSIEIATKYFGYPCIVSRLDGGRYLGPKQLEELGLALIKAAHELKSLQNRELTFEDLIVALVTEKKLK